jgi:hypothetical protein
MLASAMVVYLVDNIVTCHLAVTKSSPRPSPFMRNSCDLSDTLGTPSSGSDGHVAVIPEGECPSEAEYGDV